MVKEKKGKSLTFRLTDDDYKWLTEASYAMGTTPSKLVRQLIQISINTQKMAAKHVEESNQLKEQIKQ